MNDGRGPNGLPQVPQGLMVACFDGGTFDPAGRLVRRIDVPGARHTTLALSPDGRAIYVTVVHDTPSGYLGRLLEPRLALPR